MTRRPDPTAEHRTSRAGDPAARQARTVVRLPGARGPRQPGGHGGRRSGARRAGTTATAGSTGAEVGPVRSGTRRAAPLCGRDDELAAVDDLVRAAGSGLTGLVVVGEPGIGRSSVWERGRDGATRAGLRVLATTCVRAESEWPYAALEDLLGGVLGECDGVLPAPQRTALDVAFHRAHEAGPTDRRAVAEATLTVLRHLLRDGPVLVAVDDLHWMDAATHTCLTFAVRRLGDRPLVLLVTARDQSPLWDGEPSPDPVEPRIGHVGRLHLGPLADPAIERMLEDRLGPAPTGDEYRRIAAVAAGNPFWALRLAQHRGVGRTTALATLVDDRIAGLDENAVEAACLVAALGRPRAATVLAAVAPAGPASSRDAAAETVLDQTVGAGLLTVVDGYLAPVHPLIGAALLASLPPFRRRRLHRRAAGLADSAESRARHLLRAVDDGTDGPLDFGDSPDGASERAELLSALDDATAAARRRGAARTAALFGVRALALAEQQAAECVAAAPHPTGRDGSVPARRVGLAELHHRAGDPDAVLAVLAPLDPAALGPDLLERAGPLLAQATGTRTGPTAARRVLDGIARLPRDGRPADVLARRDALVATLRADPRCGAIGDLRSAAERAVELTGSAPVRPSLRRRARAALAGARLDEDPPGAVLDRLDDLDTLDGLDSLGDGVPEASDRGPDVAFLRGMHRWCAVDLDGARGQFAASYDRQVTAGDLPAAVRAGAMLAVVEITSGLTAAAESTLGRLEAHVERRALERLDVVTARGLLHLVRAEHDELDELLDRVTTDGNRSAQATACVERLRGLAALYRDESGDAVASLARYAGLAGRQHLVDPHRRLWALADLAEAALAAGDPARARIVADRIAEGLVHAPGGAGEVVTRGRHERILAGLLARHDGAGPDDDLDRAEALARRAVARHADGPIPGEHGRSLAVLADVLDRRGDHGAAARHRRRAHDLFALIGYRWRAERTAAPPPGRLTDGERAVADLVARGASNRAAARELHLSVRTVENHLARIYRKLGIRSRTDLRV